MAAVGNTADVAVIGGGVVGLATAIELAGAGHRVRVIEAFDFARGTSHGNAGLLCPSYVTPMASPQMLLAAIGWLMRGEGPLTLARAPWHGDMARWLARFVRACASGGRGATTRFLADLARRSIDWYAEFDYGAPELGFSRDGWLYVYNSARGFDDGLRHAQAMESAGLEAHVLGAAGAVALEPALRAPIGAVHYPGDAHLDPHAFIAVAVKRAMDMGVELLGNTRVLAIMSRRNEVMLETENGTMTASEVVLAAGSASAALARALGCRLPMLPARGHSISLVGDYRPRMPLLLAEAHLVLTPMPGRVRVTGGLELGSQDPSPDVLQAETMAVEAGKYLAGNGRGYADAWVGFRPLTPDGLPIIGRLSRNPRVIAASGHGTLGMTLAPATAQIVRSVIEGQVEPREVSPRRFG